MNVLVERYQRRKYVNHPREAVAGSGTTSPLI